MTIWMLITALAGTPDLYQLSYEQEATGSYRSALSTLDEMPGSAKATYTFKLRHAWLLYLDGQYEDSLSAYDEAIGEKAVIEAKLGKMLPLLALRRWVDAEALGRDVLKTDPKSYLGRSRTAWALYNLGRYADAATLYRDVLADYPSDVEMQAGLAWSLLGAGKSSEACGLFDDVLKVAPKHATAADGKASCP